MKKFNKRQKLYILAAGILFSVLLITGASPFIRDLFLQQNEALHEEQEMERLKSLPYLSWVPVKEQDRTKKDVVSYAKDSAYEGLNLYTSRPANSAHLIDMNGGIINTWSLPGGSWHNVAINRDGELFFLVKDKKLGKLDWNSNLIWTCNLRFHHEVHLAENGDIYTVFRDEEEIEYRGKKIPILNDYIAICSRDGEVKRKISVYKLFAKRIPEAKLKKILKTAEKNKGAGSLKNDSPYDLFHTNSVRVMEKNKNGLWQKGDILISVRELNTIAVIDPRAEKIKWSWGVNVLDRQHDASFLDNGNISVFDNGAKHRNFSRVIEVNPRTEKIVYEYKAHPPESFYSKTRGAAIKLPNGNWLITESDSGHVFEITESGKIVWEFFNPEMKGKAKRAAIYRMERLKPDFLLSIP